jgi:methylmalonyl-CoA mutase cobalamin-binding domain/chain
VLALEIDVLGALGSAIAACDRSQAAELARKSVDAGLDPLRVFEAMTAAMTEVGRRFEAGECWLPDLVGSADAMQAATPILEDEIKRKGMARQSLGTVIAGTVQGDIHTIGIQMVCTLLVGAGFAVHNLGISVRPEDFVAAVREHDASILAMSALLTVSAAEQGKVIELLEAQGIRESVKVMVGGGAITEDFARRIGADGYEPSAVGAVALAHQFVGGQQTAEQDPSREPIARGR